MLHIENGLAESSYPLRNILGRLKKLLGHPPEEMAELVLELDQGIVIIYSVHSLKMYSILNNLTVHE